MKRRLPFFILALALLAACQPTNIEESKPADRSRQVHETATAFFDTYAERKDWNKLLSFYRPDMTFEDIALQLQLDSLWQFERFYDWPDTNFHKLSDDHPALIVEQLVANDSAAIAYGRFTPFYWYGQLIEPAWGMQFVMILEFDAQLKIKKHIDWIEYDDNTLEAMIERYRTEGVDKPPSWLNLER